MKTWGDFESRFSFSILRLGCKSYDQFLRSRRQDSKNDEACSRSGVDFGAYLGPHFSDQDDLAYLQIVIDLQCC